MPRFLPTIIVAATLQAGPSAANVLLARTGSPSEAPTAQVLADRHDTVADLRERRGFVGAGLQQGQDGSWLALIRWDSVARLDRALSTLEADRRAAMAAVLRY